MCIPIMDGPGTGGRVAAFRLLYGVSRTDSALICIPVVIGFVIESVIDSVYFEIIRGHFSGRSILTKIPQALCL